VDNWAETFGKELWYLGQNITKSDEIRLVYTILDDSINRVFYYMHITFINYSLNCV